MEGIGGDRLTPVNSPIQKSERQARWLKLFNRFVLLVALMVYLLVLSTVLIEGEPMAFVPLTSLLLGVGLVYFFVETALSHFALMRVLAQKTSKN